jgi:hypothetical protein
MRANKIVAFTTAAMLLLGGVAAVGAATPADQATGTATDASADAAGANDDGVGPSDGLPDQVPEHVSGIHDRIGSFLNGSTDDLGESLREFLGGGEQADAGADQPADDTADA